ncbi:MAG: 3D domain-containing protein [Negativicutes bacterium]|nr:3D domain-containing protein [Negativicutes bacterium]
MSRKHVAVLLVFFSIAAFQPPTAHAGFFLFNIINGIFGGHHKDPPASVPAEPQAGVVKFGMQNSDVAAVQQILIRSSYLSGKADGVFGYQTLSAVKAFQRDAGLLDDGVVGSRTMGALKSFKGTKPKNAPPPKKPTNRPPPKDSGVPHYLYALPMLVTAYTRYDEGCTDYTYRGTYLCRGLCAVDPNVIPFGTRLYVPGYGEAVADDIGGAIQGNHIDLAMDSLDEAYDWGSRSVTVYVLSDA